MVSGNLSRVSVFHLCVAIGMVSWTAIIFGLYLWASSGEHDHFDEMIILKAESLAHHSQALRRWIGGHGGVYVEVDDQIKPNALLAHVPERDVETPSGRKLTLLNSPAILRAIFREFSNDEGDQIRLVSYQPLNPLNAPDDWEKVALEKLEVGEDKVQAFQTAGEESIFRLMFPMKVEPKCLNCHPYEATHKQQVVGGLSIIVDKTPYNRVSESLKQKIGIGYLGIWALGLFGMTVFDLIGARLLRQIEFSATHDSLTRLLNRREIDHLLNQACYRAGRYGNSFSVMMLDIDYFKRVNDIYGHQAGDQALSMVAEIIRATIRKTDKVGRYGGEEFLIVDSNTSEEGAKKQAWRLNKAIKAASIDLSDGKSFSITVSIGVSSCSSDINSAEALVKAADKALYRAKTQGRDRVCVEMTDSE